MGGHFLYRIWLVSEESIARFASVVGAKGVDGLGLIVYQPSALNHQLAVQVDIRVMTALHALYCVEPPMASMRAE